MTRPLIVFTILLLAVAVHAQTYKVLNNMKVNSTTGPWGPQFLGVFAQARDGNLYGTSQNGGTANHGVVFRLTPSGQVTVLHSFAASSGDVPRGGLTLGIDGNLYGTTCNGGSFNGGTVFKITTSGGYNVVHNFNINNGEGVCPEASPVQGTDGNFYGTTTEAPNPHVGTVYKMTPSGALTTLFMFNVVNVPCCTAPNGETPLALIQGADGNFYGTARFGGTSNHGTIFKITSAGKFTLLHSFNGTDGSEPIGPIIQASDGNFYGTTYLDLKIYKITPIGAFSSIFTLTQKTGDLMFAGLTQATDGKLYTASTDFGVGGAGTIFSLTTGGTPFVIHPFSLSTGFQQEVSLFQHTNGKLYGDTSGGGTGLGGVLYNLDMGLEPFVSLLPPLSSGKVGKIIELLGQGFTGTTAVKFNGTAAPLFTIVSNTFLTATVPAGATTGFVTVTTPSGTLKSNNKFRVTPQITSFTPSGGLAGTAVTITGVSLKQTSKVTFGGVAATTVTVNSDTKVTATVPSGAVTGKITVTTLGGVATSSTNFVIGRVVACGSECPPGTVCQSGCVCVPASTRAFCEPAGAQAGTLAWSCTAAADRASAWRNRLEAADGIGQLAGHEMFPSVLCSN